MLRNHLDHNHKRLGRSLAIALVLMAGTVFYVRAVVPPYFTPSDFAMYYTAGRAWVVGEDPYDREGALRTWIAAGGNADIMPPGFRETSSEPWMPILQLPTAIPVFAPFALIPAPTAVVLWFLLAGVLLIGQTAALASLAGTTLLGARGLVLLAITLLLAPVHEMFGYAQPSGPVISLMIMGAWAATCRRDILAGVLIGLAAAAKPHLAAVFILYYALSGRWRLIGTCVTLILIAGATAVVPMHFRGIPWASGWVENLILAEAPGGMNSTAIENDGRFYLLHLQVILNALFEDLRIVNGLALLIVGAMAAAFAWRRNHMRQRDELLSLGVVSFLTLLPMYHRFYDAALLVVPLAWAIGHAWGRPRFAWPILGVVLTFLLPSAAVVRFEQLLGAEAHELSTWWWHTFLQPFRTWLLLGGLVLAIGAVGARRAVLIDQVTMARVRSFLRALPDRRNIRFPARPAAIASIWVVAIIVAVLMDGPILRLFKPYAALVSASALATELKEIGHILFALALAGSVWILHPLGWRGASLVAVAAILAKMFYAATKTIMVRPRPLEMIDPFYLPQLTDVASRVWKWHEYLWPSGHTCLAFAMAGVLSFLLPRGRWAFFVTAALVGLVRIGELAHYPSDIVLYAGLGLLAFQLSRRLHNLHPRASEGSTVGICVT